jgi:predicted phosphodiesterase
MATRIALISDLHGNEVALRSVFEDIARAGVDRTVCLGDVATLGPRPGAVVAMLRDAGCPCILGNHDEFLLDANLVRAYTDIPVIVSAIEWSRSELSDDDMAFVRGFVREMDVPLDAGASLRLFHGTPRSNVEDLLATTTPDEVDSMLAGRRATVMAGGHTHVQMLRQHHGILLVNTGSVGMPFREYVAGGPPTLMPHAEYAIVDARGGNVTVELRRVALDTRALAASVANDENPLNRMLRQQWA